MIRLDLGAGAVSPEGFKPMGAAHGSAVYPLPMGDGTVDTIRASHILEHWPHAEIPAVLADWVRALRPGGELKIAVPDFKVIAENYLAGAPIPTEGYVMGGQVDRNDFHKAIFDAEHLTRAMGAAGLVLIKSWQSELKDDCAALPISLNLAGTKPHVGAMSVSAVISRPRITWTANCMSAIEALPPLGIRLRSYEGAYWHQCLERCIEVSLAEDAPDAILTLDYDTVFTRRDVSLLMQLMMVYPEADAIAAIQAARGRQGALFTMRGEDGKATSQVPVDVFAGDLSPAATAHFGLTLFRADKLRAMAKPWLHDVPAPDGGWGDGRRDADVAFWDKWAAAGNTLFNANRVPVGHIQVVALWPGEDLKTIHQDVGDWRVNGKPSGVWR